MEMNREGRVVGVSKIKGSETSVAAARLGMQITADQDFGTDSIISFRYREAIVAPISGGHQSDPATAITRSMILREC